MRLLVIVAFVVLAPAWAWTPPSMPSATRRQRVLRVRLRRSLRRFEQTQRSSRFAALRSLVSLRRRCSYEREHPREQEQRQYLRLHDLERSYGERQSVWVSWPVTYPWPIA